jgi:outer membrane protein TolC
MVLSGPTFQRVILRTVFTLLSLVGVTCLGAPADDIAGTMPEDYLPELKQILTHALRRNPEMIARDFERVMQEARVTETKAARLPNLGGNFDYGVSQTAVSSNTSSQSRSTGAQYNFSAGQALFHWGAIKNGIEISKLNLRAGSKDATRLFRDVSVALRKAYLSLIVQKARLKQARESVELVKTDLAVAEARKQDGTISPAFFEGEKLRLREADLQLRRLIVLFEGDRNNFARVAGLPQFGEQEIPADIPRPEFPEPLAAAITAQTLRDNGRSTFEWEIYDLRIQEAQLRQKIVNTRLLPKFGLGASFGQRNNTSVNGPTVSQEAVTEQRIAISGSWTLFDGFATSGAKREAAASRRALEHRQKSVIDELLQNVQQLERTLKLDAEQLALAEVRHGIAATGQEIVQEGVKEGNLPKADLRRSELNTLSAYASALEARAQFLVHWSEFVATAGVDPTTKNLSDRDAPK